MESISMAIVDTHSAVVHTLWYRLSIGNQNLPLFENLLLKSIDKEMEDQINVNQILHMSAIYIQSMIHYVKSY